MAVRRVLVAIALSLAFVVPSALTHFSDAPVQEERCPDGDALAWVLPGACQHTDVPPPGVDPTEPVSTTELRTRDGGGAEAWAAAEDLGVPAPAQAAAASPAVTCDGDGASGYRTQAMYVVEAGRTNRYAALQSSIQLWAAGVDDVFNRSAALTGGVRHVRYVTDTDGSTCVARVLNVTVPAGSMSSFNATITAVQALGYADPARKYLMWTDATVLCGVASMYPNDGQTQANPNNGSYAQYARIDAGCWGFGDGAAQHSVEAHELLHTMGGVMSTAPHGTRAGHCWDEADTMCYADGGGFAMQQICPTQREYLLDCNNDDYYSTYPDPGSWLDGHWNAADSRFLIGGGDGSGGGSLGQPTVLGATISVNNPAVPGLSTQASVAPSLPSGRTVTGVQWKAARTDCTFSAPTALQTDVACNAGSATATTVTVTLTDSSGAKKAVTSPLTFAGGPGRAVSVALGAAGQSPTSGGSAGVCTGAPFGLTATATDTASGQPVKGLATVLTRQTAAMTAPTSAGAPLTTATGTATQSQTATVVTTYRGTTKAGTVFAAAAPVSLVAVPAKCSTALSAEASDDRVYYGDAVTVSGTLEATSGSATVVPAGATLAVRLTTPAGKMLALGSAKVGADGTYALATKPTASGTITVVLAASSAYVAATATAGVVTVDLPTTSVTGAVDRTDVGYGDAIRVTGTLVRDAGGAVTPLASKSVSVFVTPPGGTAVRIGSASTTATGSYTATIPLRTSGTLSVVFAGAAGLPTSRTDVGTVTAGQWSTTLTATSAATTVPAGGWTTLSGTLSRTYGGATSPGARLRLKVVFRPTGSSTDTIVTSVTTTATGTFTTRIYPKASGTWRVTLTSTLGYADASSATRTVSVS
ncbi:hypothetical protein ACFQ0K_10670 [Nocardioides caeni]|uniref:Uncharacterized protein n=1 Tax=Nocardioides caeni TaxID=574700 RepID=A0A4S8N2T0_9ACTN|nr:hypothetical protein [Nocardioides caeni]THV09872.1 hypothetical protein E9934_15195 [Nocardioides caeni]